MKKLLAAALLLAAPLGAYERIEFRGQAVNPGLVRPVGVAVYGGRVFVADAKANAVFVFDMDGKLLKRGVAPLTAPMALAWGGDKLYVADTGKSRVAVLDTDGALLWSFSGPGSLPGQLESPKGVAFGPDNRVYVSNTGNGRVEVFNSDGIFLYGFPALRADKATKAEPAKITLDQAGFIYVSDPGKGLILKYARDGALVKEYAVPNDSVAVDEYGTIYVASSKDGKVKEISPAGEPLGTFGTRGKGRTDFLKLADIALDSQGLVYLADEGNKKVSFIAMEGDKPGARLPRAEVTDRFNLKGPVRKFALKAEAFAVKPDGSLAAWLPEAREAVLADDAGKKTLMKQGEADGQAKAPKGFFADAEGRLYVADSGNNRVQVLAADGSFKSRFGEKAGFLEGGAKEGKFDDPRGLVVNNKGTVYVADRGNKRVQAFSSDGMFLFAFGPSLGGVTLASPVAVRADEKRNLYILDSELKKVVVTDAKGKLVRVWEGTGLSEPVALEYDDKNYFYVLDKGAAAVRIFDENGKAVSSFFARGRGDRELLAPQAMYFRGTRLYISDPEAGRVAAFDIGFIPEEPAGLSAEAGDAGVRLSWKAAGSTWLKGFDVFRAPEGQDPVKLAFTDKPEFSDAGLAPGTTYQYWVAGLSITGDPGIKTPAASVFFRGPQAAAAAAAPAADAGANRAPVDIVPVELNYIFSANYKQYLKKPVGRVAVRNNTDKAYSSLKLSFNLKDFMDFPTETELKSLGPRETAEVDIMATLNNKVLAITEDTPIQCQLLLTYYEDGAEKTYTSNKPIKVLSKNAIVWDKPQRLANFITPKDTPVFAFSRFALLEKGKYEKEAGLVSENLLTAAMTWEALGELGISYLADPVSPYAALKSSGAMALDTVQFPRNTLKLKSGDCDDLTALFASIFEAAGVRAALLDYPAHIAVMFDTGMTEASDTGLPEDYLVRYNNTWWVPLETTMVGKPLADAVKNAADLYRKEGSGVRVFDVREAWGEFEPVTLPESDSDKYSSEGLSARIRAAVDALLKFRYESLRKRWLAALEANPDDADALLSLGALEAQNGGTADAEKRFLRVLEKDPLNAAALNNLGNTSFAGGDYEKARESYFKASKADPFDGEIWLNLARTAVKQGKKEDAAEFAAKASRLDPELKGQADALLK